MVRRKLVLLTAALLSAAMLWGCGSSGSGGIEVQPQPSVDDVAKVEGGNFSCTVCHSQAHTPAAGFSPLVGQLDASENALFITHECQDCHGGGSAHRGLGLIPHPRPDATRCASCHGDEVAGMLGSVHNRGNADNIAMIASGRTGAACIRCHTVEGVLGVAAGANFHNVTCAACHDPLKAELRTVTGEMACSQCHTTVTGDGVRNHLPNGPFSNEIYERFKTSRHANQNARAGFCSACHSHEGGIELLSMGRKTSLTELQASYNEETAAAFMLPVGSETIVGVMKKNCATCHDPHIAELRGDGVVLASSANVADFPAAAGTQLPATGGQAEVRVAYSAEFNLCTACHMVELNATWDTTAGYSERGMIRYELSDAYASANLVDAVTGTFDLSKAVFYHDGASGNGRTFADTHFGGTIMEHLVEFNGSAADIEIKGYNINPGNTNACTICHDPHTGGKLLSVQEGQGDNIDNLAIGYAEGVGDFHTNYIDDPFSRVNSSAGCMPCHSGDAFVRGTVPGGSFTSTDHSWKVIGCRSCHDLAQANAAPGSNNSAAFAQVREFPETHVFAFNSGVEVAAAELGVNQICFECHKGRTPGVDVAALDDPATGTTNLAISYLHYAPSFAILYGNESGMVATYPGQTYAGRFAHPLPINGVTEFGCTDCHDVHNTQGNNVVLNRMATSASCAPCHAEGAGAAASGLQARTQAFSERLLDTILAEMLTFAGQTGFSGTLDAKLAELAAEVDPAAQRDILMSYIEERQAFFPNKAIAQAAATWKVFTYEDGAPHGQAHGHGGSWAHNSAFARQVMYDAINSLGGNLTGLARP